MRLIAPSACDWAALQASDLITQNRQFLARKLDGLKPSSFLRSEDFAECRIGGLRMRGLIYGIAPKPFAQGTRKHWRKVFTSGPSANAPPSRA